MQQKTRYSPSLQNGNQSIAGLELRVSVNLSNEPSHTRFGRGRPLAPNHDADPIESPSHLLIRR